MEQGKVVDLTGSEVEYNSAKWWQILLFSFNNNSTNMSYIIISSYFLFYAQSFLGINAILVGSIMTGMRLFDGFTDPIVGVLIDRTDTKFGKFRPWMIIGNLIITFAVIMLFTINPEASYNVRLGSLILFYFIYIIGYTMQCACTKGGAVCLSNNPKQRPVLAMYYGVIGGIILTVFMMYVPMSAGNYELNMLDPDFWRNTVLLAGFLGFVFMVFAVIGIWSKDVPANYKGITSDKVSIKDFFNIIKGNRAIQMLCIAAATDKLAFSLAGAVNVYFFANIMLNQGLAGIFSLATLPGMFLFAFIGMFVARKTSQKKGFVFLTWVALISSVLGLILIPKSGATFSDPTVFIFFSFFWLQKAVSSGTGNNVITMISDCTDYETYKSGKSLPGMMGTTFSFIDKMVSSLSGLIIGLMFGAFGLANTTIEPLTPATEYQGLTAIIAFGLFVMPIIGYVSSLIAMKFYPLDAEMMEEINKTLSLNKKAMNDPRSPAYENFDGTID